jgi:uncharacterized membrane protein
MDGKSISMAPLDNNAALTRHHAHPFRRAVLRGLAVVLPPLLTIVIFVWVGRTVAVYLLEPLESAARWVLVELHEHQIRSDFPPEAVSPDGTAVDSSGDEPAVYRRVADGKFVPVAVYNQVTGQTRADVPGTALDFYRRYVEIVYLKRHIVVPLFLGLLVAALYLLGKFLAAGIGRLFWSHFERLIHRLPLVRNVYSSVKQVTDFMLSEREIEYTRVVAVEYPRKGIWSLGFVTGESLLDLRSAVNEPVLTLLIPTSPMPMTGFTVTVKKSETLDLNITLVQAFQFIISCGVVIPAQQKGLLPASGQPSGGDGLHAALPAAPTVEVSAE